MQQKFIRVNSTCDKKEKIFGFRESCISACQSPNFTYISYYATIGQIRNSFYYFYLPGIPKTHFINF